MKKQGFTLAEVLITLGIIGIVAAMTIPTLMNQTGQAEFKSGFKKIISTLSQAVTMSVALNSTDFSTLNSTPTTDEGSVYGMFNARMNVIKTVYNADAGLGGTPASIGTSNYTLFFNDGMVVSFPTVCGQTALTGAAATSVCKAVIDTNGIKKPNKLTNCASSGTATTDTGVCTSANNVIGDRFSIRFFTQQVIPNGPGARFVMYN
jgi:prepilin-type N-terminal cleavage/methylation domain-containing protein